MPLVSVRDSSSSHPSLHQTAGGPIVTSFIHTMLPHWPSLKTHTHTIPATLPHWPLLKSHMRIIQATLPHWPLLKTHTRTIPATLPPLAVAQVAHAHHPSNAAPLAVAQDAHAHHSRNAAPLAVAQDAHAHHSRNAAPLAVAQVAHAHHPSKAAPLAVAQDAHAHINTNEVDAILQGFLLFSHHWLHHTLVIHTDSSTAHAGLRKGFLHGPPNAPLKSLLILAAARDIQIVPHWLPSEENALADALSRNNFQEVANICPHWQDLSVLNRPRGSLHELLSSMQAT